jgi:zinc protease
VDETIANEKSAPSAEESGPEAMVAIGFRVNTGENIAESCAADILAALLYRHNSGRLYAPLESKSLASEITVEYDALRGPGAFTFTAKIAPEKRAEARTLFLGEIERLQRELVPATEMESARRRLWSDYLYDNETVAGEAREIGAHEMLGDYRVALDYRAHLQRVTPEDLRAFARRCFTPERRANVGFPEQKKP